MLYGVSFGRRVEVGRGAKLVGPVSLGDRVKIGPNCLLHGVIEIGPHSVIGQGSVIVAHSSIVIGRDALIAERVTIRDQSHRTDAYPYRLQGMISAPLAIGENVWIGAGAVVLKNVGSHAIIGANAVVTSPVQEKTTVGGIPARPLRPRAN